jgi:hypothetical protein
VIFFAQPAAVIDADKSGFIVCCPEGGCNGGERRGFLLAKRDGAAARYHITWLVILLNRSFICTDAATCQAQIRLPETLVSGKEWGKF